MDTITTTEVLLRLQRHDGNDPVEAVAHLPFVPRKGDMLDVWVQESDRQQYASGNRSEYLTVEQVLLCTWAPDRIEVWVTYDGYDMAEIERVFRAVEANEQP